MTSNLPKRKRGVVLTPQGLQTLRQAIAAAEQETYGERLTIEDLSDRAQLDPGTVAKVLDAEEGVDRRTLDRFFRTFELELTEDDFRKPLPNAGNPATIQPSSAVQNRADWGEAVDVSIFYGRTEELATLQRWILEDRCRLIALLGMGGMGKTSLTAKLGEQIQGEFEVVVWRSLRNAPLVEDVLVGVIQFLSDQQEINLPKSLDSLLAVLMKYLNQHRCLVVLDNTESILRGGERTGQYREGFEGYGALIRRVGESPHQSCVVLTSREKPKEVSLLEGKARPVRSLPLAGLNPADGQKILQAEETAGSESEQQELLSRYAGNPLAVKIAATTIQDLFFGDIGSFLEQSGAVFGDIRDLLDQQFDRLSELGQSVMYWLAINREAVSLAELREDFVSPITPQKLLETLESLERRSLIEKVKPTLAERSGAKFTLQNVVMEYVSDRFIEEISEELRTEKINLLNTHALIEAAAKDYVRETQICLLLKPVAESLIRPEQQLEALLKIVLNQPKLFPGYTAGNILNLFCYLNIDISSYSFSHLTIRRAYLRDVKLHNVNFFSSHFVNPALIDNFGLASSIAFSPDGSLVATGDSNGEIHILRVSDKQHLATYIGHVDWIQAIAFSPDGKFLASGSSDRTIRLWDLNTHQSLCVLQGHTGRVWSVTFSFDGKLLASSSNDCTIGLWNVVNRQCLHIFQGHTDHVISVAFSPNGQMIASGSNDQTVRLWDLRSYQCLHIFQGHTSSIHSVAFSPNGQMIASGSDDQTVRLWDFRSYQCLHLLQGHIGKVWSVAFSPDGQMLATGGRDRTIRLWDLNNYQCLHIFQGHTWSVRSVAFSPDGQTLVSGSDDQTVRLWNVKNYQSLYIFQGYTSSLLSVAFSPDGQMLASGGSGSNTQMVRLWNVKSHQCSHIFQGKSWARSVAFSPDKQTLASGSDNQTIRLWDLKSYQCLHVFQGHTNRVWSVAFSPDGQMLASGSSDRTIRLWDLKSYQCLHIFTGHTESVRSIAFSPNGQTLASSSKDQVIQLWNLQSYQCSHILRGHTDDIRSVAFSPDGQTLASGSDDQTVRLWNLQSYQCSHILQGHTDPVWTVAFSPNGQTLASGGDDQTIRLWNVKRLQCLHIFQGHAKWVRSVSFSPDGQTLASSSTDGTIMLWNIQTGSCSATLRIPRPYEGTNITGATGLTESQKASLIALGAVEDM